RRTQARCLHACYPARRSTQSIPFPYTTLFRSDELVTVQGEVDRRPRYAYAPGDVIRPGRLERPGQVRHDERTQVESLQLSCAARSEEHTSELQSRENLVCRLLLEKKK